MTGPQIYYRLVDWHYTTGVVIDTLQFRLVRKTPAGAWIAALWDHDALYQRFVLDGKGKRYAYPDLEDAKASFLIRKQRQVGHAKAALERAQNALAVAEGREQAVPPFFKFAPPVDTPPDGGVS